MAFFPQGFGYEAAKAEATVARQRLNDCEYIFLHKACFVKNTKAGDAIIIEHEIVEAKKIKDGVDPTPVGSSWGYFLPLYGDAAVMAKPNLKAYALGLLGFDEKKVTPEQLGPTLDEIGGPAQAARGMLIKGITFHTNKKDGEDFQGVNWFAVPGENIPGSPNVLARRAKLDVSAGSAPTTAVAPPAPAPGVPGVPTAPVAAPPVANPLQAAMSAGWQKHPTAVGYWYLGQTVKTEADLIAGR